jgi:hypothetical protein
MTRWIDDAGIYARLQRSVQIQSMNHLQIDAKSQRHTIEYLEKEVHLLNTRLRASEIQSNARFSALECLSYVTKLPSCDICFERLDGQIAWWLLETKCGNHFCTGCFRQYSKLDLSLAVTNRQKRCPWNTCVLRDENGEIVKRLVGGKMVSTVGPCTIVNEFTRDDALERIVQMREFLAVKYKDKIVPNVFESGDVPVCISGMVL